MKTVKARQVDLGFRECFELAKEAEVLFDSPEIQAGFDQCYELLEEAEALFYSPQVQAELRKGRRLLKQALEEDLPKFFD